MPDHDRDVPSATSDAIGLQRPVPRTWRDRLGSIADATGVPPARLAAGAVAVAIAAGLGWGLLRPPDDPAELSIPFTSTTSARPGSPSPSGDSTAGQPGPGDAVGTANGDPPLEELVVHVAGAVGRPGLVRVRPAGRVADAVAAAGGLAPDADLDRFNLAAPLQDGQRVYVPRVGRPVPAEVGGDLGQGSTGGATLSLNAATAAELDALPGVGPTTAAAIVSHREAIGRFDSVDQLLDVRGIGEAKLEQIRPLVTLD